MQQLRYSGPSSPRMANNCRCYISQIIGVRHFYVRSVASLGSRSVWCRAWKLYISSNAKSNVKTV